MGRSHEISAGSNFTIPVTLPFLFTEPFFFYVHEFLLMAVYIPTYFVWGMIGTKT
jgi:hypothetical protein